MRRLSLVFVGVLFLLGIVSAVPATKVDYFYSESCSHCANVAESGVLDEVGLIDGVVVEKYSVDGPVGRELYLEFIGRFDIERSVVPFLVIEQGGEFFYLMGDGPIIDGVEDAILNFEGVDSGGFWDFGKITFGVVVVAALIDSINPCAFGVLIFLMIILLSMGSAKRALRAGLIYSFVVFVVYFLVGLGIFHAIDSVEGLSSVVYVVAGVLVLGFGVWQFKDVLFPKVGPTLGISPRVKPFIEKVVRKGTIPAIVVLGVFVSLVELPCTGGIYLGILSLMSMNKAFAFSYLVLYNLIFVLPLVVLSYLIYRGMSPEFLQKWTQSEKKWMKIVSGIVLVLLGIWILIF